MSAQQPTPRATRWIALVSWLAVCAAVIWAVSDVLDGLSRQARLVWTGAGWLVVGVGLVAVLVPSVLGLVVLRSVASLAALAAFVAWSQGASTTRGAVAGAAAILMVVVAGSAAVGEEFVQASAYGAERRLLLRPPVSAMAPLAITWAASAAATVGGLWLVAASRWWGIGVLAVGVAAGWLAAGLGYRLARRWLVVVPSGIVIHDHVALAETLMVTIPNVAGAGLALVGSEAADLTGPAAGHAIEIQLRESATVLLPVTRDHPAGRAIHARSVLIAPSRPGRALRAMAERRVPVGGPG